ncbi:MAG: 2,3,4,5-tetrahydropyridine-2,6-dicarboxylate N-succinyltransferase [Pseudomarimonas sp.]
MSSPADVETLRWIIEDAFERRSSLEASEIETRVRPAVERVLDDLEAGRVRVAQPIGGEAGGNGADSIGADQAGGWQVNDWLKKAVLLYFRVSEMQRMDGAPAPYWDKVPLRFHHADAAKFVDVGARIVPGAVVRRGAHLGRDSVLMPSFVNIGAFVGARTMVDTWATVGSCAQIGADCHLSGGVGIGGVLEPLQASPTIIEDNCFVGARSEVVEGVIVERGSVIGMGVFLGQSTKIFNRATGEVSYGRVPAGSVVVAGSLPAADGSHSLYAAVIVKQVDERTRSKTSINELLRA